MKQSFSREITCGRMMKVQPEKSYLKIRKYQYHKEQKTKRFRLSIKMKKKKLIFFLFIFSFVIGTNTIYVIKMLLHTLFSVIYCVLNSIDLHMQHITDLVEIHSHMSFSNRMTFRRFSRAL